MFKKTLCSVIAAATIASATLISSTAKADGLYISTGGLLTTTTVLLLVVAKDTNVTTITEDAAAFAFEGRGQSALLANSIAAARETLSKSDEGKALAELSDQEIAILIATSVVDQSK